MGGFYLLAPINVAHAPCHIMAKQPSVYVSLQPDWNYLSIYFTSFFFLLLYLRTMFTLPRLKIILLPQKIKNKK